MSNAAKRGRPSKRDASALNDDESASDQPAEKSVKREEETVPSAQVMCLQETKKAKSEPELENDTLKSQIDRLIKEKTELQARSGMPQESASALLDRMEKMGEMSFMNLPRDIHIRFFKDFPSCLKFRLNKSLDGLFLRVTEEMAVIDLKISSDYYELALYKSWSDYAFSTRPPRQYHNFDQLVQGLNRLALNTSVTQIRVDIATNENNCRIFEALSNFNTYNMFVFTSTDNDQSPLNCSILRNFAQNFNRVNLDFTCTSISGQDLCNLRKNMLENESTLKTFRMKVDAEMEKSIVKECFGVTIEEVRNDEQRIWTRVYRSDESIEFYGNVFFGYIHFGENLETCISHGCLSFCKISNQRRYVSKKIEMNHLYSRY